MRNVYRGLFIFLAACILALSLFPQSAYAPWMVEDGPVENIQAVLCFLGAYICLRDFFMRKKLFSRRDWALLIAAALFIFVGAEEISWGQRILGIHPVFTGPFTNYQKEVNLHNAFGIDKLIAYGGLAVVGFLTCALPVLTHYYPGAKKFCVKRGIPLMPRTLCVSMWLGFMIFVVMPCIMYGERNPFNIRLPAMNPLKQLSELYFYLVLFLYMFTDYFHLLKHRKIFDPMPGRTGGKK